MLSNTFFTQRVATIDRQSADRSAQIYELVKMAQRSKATLVSGHWRNVRIFKIISESSDVKSFYLSATDNRPLPFFHPGQHVIVRPAEDTLDCAGKPLGQLTRCYTLSGNADPNVWRISVKRQSASDCEATNRQSMSQYLHDQVGIGSLLKVRGPSGNFSLASADPTSPLVLLVAGIGVTPAIAMAKTALATTLGRPVWMFYQARDPKDTPFSGALLQLAKANQNLALSFAFSKLAGLKNNTSGLENVRIEAGRQAAKNVIANIPFLTQGHFFCCGPNRWMREWIDALGDAGVDKARIHFESFGGQIESLASNLVNDQNAHQTSNPNAYEIFLQDSQKTICFDGSQKSLLDQLSANGTDIASGCRVGSCGSCITRLLSGQVQYTSSVEADLEEGWILPCVARPCSNLALQL